jgi:hypothetical protein
MISSSRNFLFQKVHNITEFHPNMNALAKKRHVH